MKHYFERVTAVALLLAMLAGLLGGVPFAATSAAGDAAEPPTDIEGNPIVNLMAGMNESFEELTIPGWSVMEGVVQADDHLYGVGGVWSLKLCDSFADEAVWSVSDKNEIKAGEDYTLSAQVYGGIGQMTVYFYDKDGNELSDLTAERATEKAADEWQELSVAFTAADNAATFAVKVSTTNEGKEAVWFDAVTLSSNAGKDFRLEMKNPDFNEPWAENAKIAPGWIYSGNYASAFDKGNGDLALCIKRANTTYTVKSERFAILPGKAYTVTADLLQTAEMNGQLCIKFYTDATTTSTITLASANRSFVTFGGAGTTEDWVKIAANGVAPANANYAEIWVTSPWKGGTADQPEYTYFDNIDFNYAEALFNTSFESNNNQSDGTPMGIGNTLGITDAVSNGAAHTGEQSLLATSPKLFYSFYVMWHPVKSTRLLLIPNFRMWVLPGQPAAWVSISMMKTVR